MINQALKSIKEISVLAAFMQKDIDDINTHLEDLKKAGIPSNILQKIISYRQKTIAEREHLLEKRTEIINRISRVDDALYRRFLMARYVDGMSCKKLAEELNFSNGDITKLSKRAHAAFKSIRYQQSIPGLQYHDGSKTGSASSALSSTYRDDYNEKQIDLFQDMWQ